MTGLISLPLAASATAVSSTLQRLETAALYASAYESRSQSRALAGDWAKLLTGPEAGDTELLGHLIRHGSIAPYTLLDLPARSALQRFALQDTSFRAALQAGAERTERSVGLDLPLRFALHADPASMTDDDPIRGLPLYLGMPAHFEGFAKSTQYFVLGRHGNAPAPARKPLLERIHSPLLKGHFARRDIEYLASHELSGNRAIALSSPLQVTLFPDRLTRVGRFTFLGLQDPDHADPNAFVSLANQADVLILGGVRSVSMQSIARWHDALQPRLLIATGDEPHLFRAPNRSGTAIISREQPGWIEMDTNTQTLVVSDGFDRLKIGWERSQRFLERLEKARPGVSQGVFGSSLKERGDWRWSQSVLNGVIPRALSYLLQLDGSPEKTGSLKSREECLINVVRQMTEPLLLHGADVDHVAAFKEILLQCGLLQKNGAT